MKNTEKNTLVLDCLKEALQKIYPDETKASRAVIESTFKACLAKVGLVGLYDNLIDVFINTLIACGLVGEEFFEDEDDDEAEAEVVKEPEIEPATIESPSASVYTDSL